MAKPYSQDLRERAVEAVAAGAPRRAAAARFKVSVSSVMRWVQRWRGSGEIAAKPPVGSVWPLEDHKAMILSLAAEQPSGSLTRSRDLNRA